MKLMKPFTISFFLLFLVISGRRQGSTMVLSIERLRTLDHDIQELKDLVRDQRTTQASLTNTTGIFLQ